MDETANTLKPNSRNLISRNRPVALIANACTFVGAALTKHLISKDIQVIAIDDLASADRKKLGDAVKSKDFHSVNFQLDNDEILLKFRELKLPRLDYGFFLTDTSVPDIIIGKGIVNFLKLVKEVKENAENNTHSDRPRLALVTSINLYGKNLNNRERILKEAEIKFASGIKHLKLNGRVVRLAEVFGPEMELTDSPLSLLIEASIKDKLADITTSLDFTQRSLFIEDATTLLIKSVLSGSTSNKIYDGAMLHPIKLSDIKQILQEPMWFEENKAEIEKLPEWPTPNLKKTIKELSWHPKTSIVKALRETIAYFKEHKNEIPRFDERKTDFKSKGNWSFAGTGFLKDESKDKSSPDSREIPAVSAFEAELKSQANNSFFSKTKRGAGLLIIMGLLVYGLIWPFVYLGWQGFQIRNNLLAAKNSLEAGDFDQSEKSAENAQKNITVYKQALDNLKILQKVPGLNTYYNKSRELVSLGIEGVDGVFYATRGSKSLFETTKIISGESRDDPQKYYQLAETDLDFASEKLSRVSAGLEDPNLKKDLPQFAQAEIDNIKEKLSFYLSLVEQTKSAASLMPKITGLEGKKSYLVLLQNNLELRPTGGFIGSYAKLDFENGRLTNIKVDDIYSLDGNLKDVISPPLELKQDLNQDRLYLRDTNYDPDFPTAARQASFFYKKESGEAVNGVIALDLKASGNLLDAVGGLDLPEYGETVNGANLFERAISHAETSFFPGSQAKKNYLTSLQNQLFNKIFYLSKQNWPEIIQAIGKSLQEKHILVYFDDPSLFSYLASSNWSGVFPRGTEDREGETSDFLSVIESNMGANKANYFLQKKYDLASSFTKEGQIRHQLKITYRNTSPSEIFPAGIYKNRFKFYTPLGTRLTKAMLGEDDITSAFTNFSDYGRTGYSALIQIAPKEQKQLVLEYELSKPLNFNGNQALYKLEILKQPGTIADPFDFSLTYPINFKINQKPDSGTAGVQEINIQTDLLTDRVFQFKIAK